MALVTDLNDRAIAGRNFAGRRFGVVREMNDDNVKRGVWSP